jgi:AcrR family transcriptional regulator
MAKAEYRSAIRSKKLITDALADLLQEKLLDKITVTDVVTRAGINRGTFYAHYADIPDVIHHLIQKTFSQIRDVLAAEPQLMKIPGVLLGQIQQILESDLEFYKKVMSSSAASVMYEQMVDVTIEYLLQNEQDYAFISHEQYLLTIRFCAGGLGNLYRDWFDGKLNMTLPELTRAAQKLLNSVMAIE